MVNCLANCQTRFLKLGVNVVRDTTGMKPDRYKTHDIEIIADRMLVEDTAATKKNVYQKVSICHASWRKCIDGFRSRFE
jgi:hypothetical protein